MIFPLGPVWGDLSAEDEPPKILIEQSSFSAELTSEEINILAILMMQGWLQRQVTSIENTRMKYSGTDFKFTSQANHLLSYYLYRKKFRDNLFICRLYKRRKITEDGSFASNWSVLIENSALD